MRVGFASTVTNLSMPAGAWNDMTSPPTDRSTGRLCGPGSGSDAATHNAVQGSARSPADDRLNVGGWVSRTPVSVIIVVALVPTSVTKVASVARPLPDSWPDESIVKLRST